MRDCVLLRETTLTEERGGKKGGTGWGHLRLDTPPSPALHQHLPVIVHALITSKQFGSSLQPGHSPVPGASSIDQRTSCFKCLEI